MKLLRTVIYVRSEKIIDDEDNSLTSQINELVTKVVNNKEYSFRGIYSDEIEVKTKNFALKGFLSLLKDADLDLYDVIIAKSITRFAYEKLDTFEYIRKLRKMNIRVIFIDEDIDTMNPNDLIKLKLLEEVTIEEMNNRREDINYRLKEVMLDGKKLGANKKFGYLYDEKINNWIIQKDEAKIVQMIFDLYLSGYGSDTICNKLLENNIKTPTGKDKWVSSHIIYILKNEMYCGDLLYGKSCTIFKDNKLKTVQNDFISDKYCIKNHHEPIISREDFDKVQDILKKKKKKRSETRKMPNKAKIGSCFTKRMRCGFCGNSMRVRGRDKNGFYSCDIRRIEMNKECTDSKSIKVEVLKAIWIEAMQNYSQNKYYFTNDIYQKQIEYINRNANYNYYYKFDELYFKKLVQCVVYGEKDNPYNIKFILNNSSITNPWITKEEVLNNDYICLYSYTSKYKRDYLFYGNVTNEENKNYTVSLLFKLENYDGNN